MNNKTYHNAQTRREVIKDAVFIFGSFAACYVTLLAFAACL